LDYITLHTIALCGVDAAVEQHDDRNHRLRGSTALL